MRCAPPLFRWLLDRRRNEPLTVGADQAQEDENPEGHRGGSQAGEAAEEAEREAGRPGCPEIPLAVFVLPCADGGAGRLSRRRAPVRCSGAPRSCSPSWPACGGCAACVFWRDRTLRQILSQAQDGLYRITAAPTRSHDAGELVRKHPAVDRIRRDLEQPRDFRPRKVAAVPAISVMFHRALAIWRARSRSFQVLPQSHG